MSLLNLGIVAHVDAGKTSLTERLLFEAGVIAAPGSVDAGTTRTDSMDLERRRGITIRSAVTSFDIGDLTVNLLDTPGHPDFIAEVERSLTVLDGAILVLSSVEGVQPQSVVIWRALRRLCVPTLMFVNKVDRGGADVESVIADVRRRLHPNVLSLAFATAQGTRDASVRTASLADPEIINRLTEVDDRLLTAWVNNRHLPVAEVRRSLRRAVGAGTVGAVTCGSAITGAGVPELRAMVADLLPRAAGRADVPAAGTVFAIDRDDRGKQAHVRLWAGRICTRDQLSLSGREPERITEVQVSRHGRFEPSASAATGEVAAVRGLVSARIGDTFGPVPDQREIRLLPASMRALIEPLDPTQRTALFDALSELAEEDPLINLRIDDVSAEVAVDLHGVVQREVIGALLAERYAVEVRFREISTVCIERVVGTGEALELVRADGNPYLATIGLRVEAAPSGTGVVFSPGVERGNLPPAFIAATEEGVRSALRQGLFGWEVTDCRVTLTQSGYFPRQSHPHQKFNKAMSSVGADFRHLAPVVVMSALATAGTHVCEPVDRFELELPDSSLNSVLAELGRLAAVTTHVESLGSYARLNGTVPSSQVAEVSRRLPDLTGGAGVLVSGLDHYAPVRGQQPVRRRVGPDPLDRLTWFREVPR